MIKLSPVSMLGFLAVVLATTSFAQAAGVSSLVKPTAVQVISPAPCTKIAIRDTYKFHSRNLKVKHLHKQLTAGRNLAPAQLRTLADSGDRLASYRFGKMLESSTAATAVDDSVHYYSIAAQLGQGSAIQPLAGLLRIKSGKVGQKRLKLAQSALFSEAKRGNTDAMFAMAMFYRDGTPFDLHQAESFHLLCQAALGGSSEAAFLVGTTLSTGEHSAAELSLAKKMLQSASSSGNLMAQALLEDLEARQ